MSLLNASWTWESPPTAECTSTASSSSSSSPRSSPAHFTDPNTSQQSGDCPATATTCSSVILSTATTRCSSSSATPSAHYRSKSDAFFSSYASMAPIKPPSPIFSRRASESCLPPPCAAPARLAAKVAMRSTQSSSPSKQSMSQSSASTSCLSSKKHASARERFSSLPDIREHQGLGIRSRAPEAGDTTPCSSAVTFSSSNSSRSTSGSASGSSSPCNANRQSAAVEDIEARLQAAISNLRGGSSSSEEEGEEDMYNDTPSSSSSASTTSRASATRHSLRQQPQQSVFEEEEDDDDDENGGTTIRIRLASAGDLMTRHARGYEQDSEDEQEPFEPCYPLTPLDINYKPLHRIRRNRSLRRALSDSCTTIALQSSSRNTRIATKERPSAKGRKVSFCDSVQVVDVFAAIDYPARRGPPPIERLTMRDVLELRQIKLELAAYMGEEIPQIEPDNRPLGQQPFEEETESGKAGSSLPTTPALEGSSPLLEQAGEATPLASNINPAKNWEEGQVNQAEDTCSSRCAVPDSKISFPSSALGPGIQIDLHSLIASTTGSSAAGVASYRQEQDEDEFAPSDITSTIRNTSFSYSSPISSMPGSEDNSLSCSPATSDSEFGSGSGTLSSCEEYYDDVLRRVSGDTSCDDDDEDEQDCGHEGIDEFLKIHDMSVAVENARTPTRVSLLRPDQFGSPPLAQRKNITTSLSEDIDSLGKIDVGCIEIALPALDGNDGYSSMTTPNHLPSTTLHQDAWNPPTF